MARRQVWITMFLIIVLLWSVVDLSSATTNDPRYIGCYKVEDVQIAGAWDNVTSNVSVQMTVDVCAAECARQRGALSGLLNGNQCWCSNNTVYGKDNCPGCCGVPCEGNRLIACGGTNAFKVYEAVVDSRYLGCFQDNGGARIFSENDYVRYPSIDECIHWCGSENFSFAGTQFRKECWCGQGDYAKYGRCITEQNCTCNMRCDGNKTEICGAAHTMSVYRSECREPGKWGEHCTKTCHCNDGALCNITGQCPNDECAPGWTGHTCNQECEPGKFGLRCQYQCRCNNSADCKKTTGTCADNICSPGYTGPHSDPACQAECENGRFGDNCVHKCHCFNSPVCNKTTGHCQNGCAEGYDRTDKTCQTECQAGTYGVGCRNRCKCPNAKDCDKVTGDCKKDASASKAVIALSVIAVILFIIVAISLVIFKREIREQYSKLSGFKFSKFSVPNVIALYENWDGSTSQTLIPLENLESVVLAQKRLELPYDEEYRSLSKGDIDIETGNKVENRQKNRFKNIIPYDSARVKLNIINNNPYSDYINASFIDGYKKKHQFIASQAPTKKTVEDFWRMLWEQDVKIIVMLTELVEGAKLKCHKYWADNEQTLCTGDMAIKTLSEDVYQDYIVRMLKITKGSNIKEVTQMHYTAWKDYNVPDNGNTMLHFHLKVKERTGNSQGDADVPVVVHCSAGVGRTGTFIALDYLLEQAKKERAIDIFACVEKMRAARVNMVNSRIQYEYLHDTMLEWYKVGLTSVETTDFTALYTDSNKISQQYQLLDSICKNSVRDFEDLSGNQQENKKKNRKTKIIPVSSSQVKLMTKADTEGDYINAVFVDGYQKRNAFIATQLPLPNTRGDFWRMVWDYKLSIVISLFDEPKEFWPEQGRQTNEGLFHIETQCHTEMGNKIAAYDIRLTYQDKSQNVKIIRLSGFNRSEDSLTRLLEVHSTVQMWQKSQKCNTLLVQCLYGVELCGIFIAVFNLLRMINTEREVDVFQVVKRMRAHRPEFIQNLEEYQLIYKIIHQYLHNDSNLYMNII